MPAEEHSDGNQRVAVVHFVRGSSEIRVGAGDRSRRVSCRVVRHLNELTTQTTRLACRPFARAVASDGAQDESFRRRGTLQSLLRAAVWRHGRGRRQQDSLRPSASARRPTRSASAWRVLDEGHISQSLLPTFSIFAARRRRLRAMTGGDPTSQAPQSRDRSTGADT